MEYAFEFNILLRRSLLLNIMYIIDKHILHGIEYSQSMKGVPANVR